MALALKNSDRSLRFGLLVAGVLPWLASMVAVGVLAFTMLFLQNAPRFEKDELTVRKMDVALPSPPPPPPPVELKRAQADSPAPTINLVSAGGGADMRYSDKPELSTLKLETVVQPEFDVNSLDLQGTLSLDFPVVEVKELDAVPRAVSSGSIKYPSALVKRNIKRVSTQVELIIDQRGKAYIKKIVDPVYPEMIDPIREWVAKVQFSIPTKDGRPIQAIYLYTLNFVYRI